MKKPNKAKIVLDNYPMNCGECPLHRVDDNDKLRCPFFMLPLPIKYLEERKNGCPILPETEIIACHKCIHWDKEDGMFPDFDDKQWHHCKWLEIDTPEYFYCEQGADK